MVAKANKKNKEQKSNMSSFDIESLHTMCLTKGGCAYLAAKEMGLNGASKELQIANEQVSKVKQSNDIQSLVIEQQKQIADSSLISRPKDKSIDLLEKKVSKHKEKNNSFKNLVLKLNERLDILEEENKVVREENRKVIEESRGVIEENRKIIEENHGLKAILIRHEERIEALELQNQTFKEELSKVVQENKNLREESSRVKDLEKEIHLILENIRIKKLLLLFKELSGRRDPSRNEIAHVDTIKNRYNAFTKDRQLLFLEAVKKYLEGKDLEDVETKTVEEVFATDIGTDDTYRELVLKELDDIIRDLKNKEQ